MAWNRTTPPLGPPRPPSADVVVRSAAAAKEARLPLSVAAITLPGDVQPFPVEGDEQDGRVSVEEVAGPRGRLPGSTTLAVRPRMSETM